MGGPKRSVHFIEQRFAAIVMSENQNPEPVSNIPLDVTSDGAPARSDEPVGSPAQAKPNSTNVPTDVTTDFDESDSSPSHRRLGLVGSAGTTGSAPRTHSPNQMVADYRLDVKLGEGGMGRVFRAVDPQGRAVAIKLLSQHLALSDEALQRFKQEGIIASQINHPHCVFVHRVDDDRGTPFIAMELMTGKTLKDLVQKQGALPYKDAVRLILQCIDGLIEAHRLGMIHRDIKPANCYLDEEGNVKIGDFGLARSLVDDSELTRTGAFIGTPLFASPEQLLGQKIDERSDIYSLSATLYYLLAGRAPFESPNAAQVIAKIASSDPPPFKENDVEVPAALEAVVMHGLARDRNKRFESFEKMRAELSPFLAPDREIASLPRRAIAYLLDVSIFGVLFRMLSLPAISALGVEPLQHANGRMFLSVTCWFFYLWLCEWLLGWTIGKRILKLKVVDSQLGMRQRAGKLLVRTAIFVACTESISLIYELFFAHLDILPTGVSTLSNFVVGASLCLLTWKKSGRRQLTFEWFSQTETCMAVSQRKTVSAQLQLPEWSLPMVSSNSYPAQLGRFAIKGQLLTAQSEVWLLAHDVKLDREVWIHWLPVGAPPISEQRKSCTLRSRMRVIESGTEQNRHWDAFLAPDGVPLCVFNRQGCGQVPWPIAHDWIHQLVAEVVTNETSSASDELWNVNRYWLDGAGRLTFAEAELDVGESASINKLEHVFQEIALAALAPKHHLRRKLRAVKNVRPHGCEIANLPTYHGLRLLEKLARKRLTLPQIQESLSRTNRSAEQVTPSMRFVHASAVTLLVVPFMVALFLCILTQTVMNVSKLAQQSMVLAAAKHMQELPENYPTALESLTPDEKEKWLSPEGRARIDEHLVIKQNQLKSAFMVTNGLERTVLQGFRVDEKFIDSSMVPSELERIDLLVRDSATSASTPKTPPEKYATQFDERGLEQVPMKGFFKSIESDVNLWVADLKTESQLTFFRWFVLGGLALLTLWTGLTRGGLAQLLTGINVVRRDGRKAGIIRTTLRSLILFGPLAGLGYLILELDASGVEWMWLTSQLKIILFALPGFYLVGGLIWPQVAPHDRICQTVMVPR